MNIKENLSKMALSKRCINIAHSMALKELKDHDIKEGDVTCFKCEGTGRIYQKMFGRLVCMTCDGKGYFPYNKYLEMTRNQYIWCRCEDNPSDETDFGFEPREIIEDIKTCDGQDVFGKTTWVCGYCGLVAKFDVD